MAKVEGSNPFTFIRFARKPCKTLGFQFPRRVEQLLSLLRAPCGV
jgi:hypothetical protein